MTDAPYLRQRSRRFHKHRPPAGAQPGALAISPAAVPPIIHVTHYTDEQVVEATRVERVEDLVPYRRREGRIWVDVQGLGDEAVLRALGEMFQIHPLALADVANTPQRPRTDTYENHTLYISRMLKVLEDRSFEYEQVSVFVGADYVLTFQDRYGDVFDIVRTRLRDPRGMMRRSGPGYLAYALIDAIIDGYYLPLEMIGEAIETLEDEVMARPSQEKLVEINQIKRELMAIRRAIWPQRDALAALLRDESGFFGAHVRVYLRDTFDHCIQLTDVLENYRELAGSLLNIYFSSVSHRTNEVMKVLTIMASIFIPLTFLAGVYGMNFQHMPELAVRWAYPVLLGAMLLTALGMILFFRHRGWIGSDEDS